MGQKIYQPKERILIRTEYFSFEVWTDPELAAEDCECSVEDIKEYDQNDIEGFQIVR